MFKLLLVLVSFCALAACASSRTVPEKTVAGFSISEFAKTDIDRVAEAHQREIFQNLRVLTGKLYRRNPRELKKSGRTSIAAGMARIFDENHAWNFPGMQGRRGTQAIAWPRRC